MINTTLTPAYSNYWNPINTAVSFTPTQAVASNTVSIRRDNGSAYTLTDVAAYTRSGVKLVPQVSDASSLLEKGSRTRVLGARVLYEAKDARVWMATPPDIDGCTLLSADKATTLLGNSGIWTFESVGLSALEGLSTEDTSRIFGAEYGCDFDLGGVLVHLNARLQDGTDLMLIHRAAAFVSKSNSLLSNTT